MQRTCGWRWCYYYVVLANLRRHNAPLVNILSRRSFVSFLRWGQTSAAGRKGEAFGWTGQVWAWWVRANHRGTDGGKTGLRDWILWKFVEQLENMDSDQTNGCFKYTYLYSFNVKTLMFLRVLPHQYVVFYSSIRCYFEVQMQQEEAERHRQVEEHQLRVQHAQVWGLRGKSKTQDHWIRKFNVFFFFWGGVCLWNMLFVRDL